MLKIIECNEHDENFEKVANFNNPKFLPPNKIKLKNKYAKTKSLFICLCPKLILFGGIPRMPFNMFVTR